jgi:hydroxypyruvate isomerase
MDDCGLTVSFCLEMLYTELPFLSRLAAAGSQGVRNIEFWDYRDKELVALQRAVDRHRMNICVFSGNRLHGMLDPRERAAFLAEVEATAKIANTLGVPRLMLLVQPLRADGSAVPPARDLAQAALFPALVECCSAVADLAEAADIEFVIEPLNSEIDHPGYFLNNAQAAFACIEQVNHPRIKLLYDIYHMSAMGERVLHDLESHLDLIGHLHAADLPGRHEPGSGRIDYPAIFSLLRALHYDRTVGFEFWPSGTGSAAAIEKAFRSAGCS